MLHLPDRLVRSIDQGTQLVYRWTGGKLGHRQMGWSVLLLTTTGRRSGLPRTHALIYLEDGDRLLVVASNNGADRRPAWYLNLMAQPEVRVQAGSHQGTYIARTASPSERGELWARLVDYHPPFAQHQRRTARALPVIILSRVADRVL